MIIGFLHVGPRIGEIVVDYLAWVIYFFPFLVAWLVWRFWRFTLHPLLKPDELEYLPYWIPCELSKPS